MNNNKNPLQKPIQILQSIQPIFGRSLCQFYFFFFHAFIIAIKHIKIFAKWDFFLFLSFIVVIGCEMFSHYYELKITIRRRIILIERKPQNWSRHEKKIIWKRLKSGEMHEKPLFYIFFRCFVLSITFTNLFGFSFHVANEAFFFHVRSACLHFTPLKLKTYVLLLKKNSPLRSYLVYCVVSFQTQT